MVGGVIDPPTPPGPRLLLQGGRGDTFTRFFKAFPAAAAGGVKTGSARGYVLTGGGITSSKIAILK